jgi:hypothetical protein
MIFRSFVEQTKDAVHSLAGGLAGGRPLSPMLHMDSATGVGIYGIDARFFTEPDGRSRLIHGFVLPLIREHRASKVAWTYTGEWSYYHAERVDGELVVANFVDPERSELWTAEIHRPPAGVPFVGDWQFSGPDEHVGPFIRPIQEAMR